MIEKLFEGAVIAAVTIVAMLFIGIPIALYWAWAGTILWGWFIVPIFHVPAISVLQMYGVVLTLSVIRPTLPTTQQQWGTMCIFVTIGPLLSLAVGHVVKSWWM